ncbi:MAG TPA: outer membrane beta-barrel protein, partial [Tepidisphaeraceae bacterium]|nr:outer membrane beta-barrel protein [Tepidisphaeraceae bacterium]
SPENQFDLLQAYVDFALPVGSGLRIRAGKFVTLLGYEVIGATSNAFYSHSYMFGFAIPFTHTGILGEYKLSDDLLLDAGITRGWNQTFRDNNGSPDFLGGLTFTPQESDFLKKWKFLLNLSEGPQGTHDNSDWWTVLDFQAIWTATDKLTLAANIDYGDAPHAPGVAGAAQWYGIAGYAAYVLNDYLTPNLRLEYYGDTKGFTLGTGTRANLYEASLNCVIKPFPSDALGSNLVLRPELRYDYSEKGFFKAGTHHDQLTFGIDAYFTF